MHGQALGLGLQAWLRGRVPGRLHHQHPHSHHQGLALALETPAGYMCVGRPRQPASSREVCWEDLKPLRPLLTRSLWRGLGAGREAASPLPRPWGAQPPSYQHLLILTPGF